MSTVVIIHDQADRDVSSAIQYGKIITIFPQEFKLMVSMSRTIEMIEETLQDFDVKKDYLIWTGGDPLGLLLVGMYFANRNETKLNWLTWNRERDKSSAKKGYYIPRLINTSFSEYFRDHNY